MKRDDVILEPRLASAPLAALAIARRPMYLDPEGEGCRTVFAWYHAPLDATPDRVAVICPPVLSEYTRSHRSLRHLADRLARAGIPALRFDYDGTGDSPGSDLDAGRFAAWQASVRVAIRHARRLSGAARVSLVGVRLGASLAASVAQDERVEDLVLWNPCVAGRAYVRELQALAMAAEKRSCDIPGAIESAGFVMTEETLASVRAVNLLEANFRVDGRVLVAGRDDLAPDAKLAERLAALGVAHDSMRLPGWSGMMAEHQFTVVPDAALDAIVAWLGREARPTPAAQPLPAAPRESVRFRFDGADGVHAEVEEMACRFGAEGQLFGILSRPVVSSDRPAIVVFNAGAAHHVGPNRLYTELTRSLAALGFPCLRFDLESLGDSVNRDPAARENYPYPHTATADGKAAIEFLQHRFGYGRFIALGLCSGAHTVFHLGLELPDAPIEELVMINPMQFYWVEGMSLDTSRRFEDMVQYRKSMRDPRRWLKLARGNVNFRRLAEVVVGQARTHVRAYWEAACELLRPEGGPRLSRDLKRLFAWKRRVTLFVSEGDPGVDVLLALARLTATRALRDGRIRLQTIAGADHTFSQWKPRREVIARLVAHLQKAASSYKGTGAV